MRLLSAIESKDVGSFAAATEFQAASGKESMNLYEASSAIW
jgi:hypothetical protein